MIKPKIRKSLLSVVLLAGALVLTGCGEETYELQDNEREIIVNYAAHIVSKYNVKQPEGYRYVHLKPEDETETGEAQGTQTEENGTEDNRTEGNQAEQGQQEQGVTEGDVSDQTQEDLPADVSDQTEEVTPVTLSEALGLKDIQAVYTGAELTDRYDSIVPDSGKKLLILHVTLQNQTKKAKKCDILSLLPVFRAKVNGIQEVTAELTILPENLSTWEEKIPAESSADTIILFQLNEGDVTAVEQLELEVIAKDKKSRVVFM